MTTTALLAEPPLWLNTTDAEDIALCTIGRLTRNLPGIPFPGWSTTKDRTAAVEQLLPVLRSRRGFKTAWHADMAELDYGTRQVLRSQLLISPAMAARQGGCHVLIPNRKHVSFMLNEEEHLVGHFFRRGLDISGAHRDMEQCAAELQENITFAHDRRNGYLASYPMEAGEGMRFYAVMHLPGLNLAGMMPQVTKAMEKLHINVNAVHRGADNEEAGNVYGFFSLSGPENSTAEIAEYFNNVMQRLRERELQVRRKLADADGKPLQDRIGRAYGRLRYACALSLKEIRDALSLLRLGTVLGLIRWEAADVLPLLRELELEMAQFTALTPAEQTAALPVTRAAEIRQFLTAHPHSLTFL